MFTPSSSQPQATPPRRTLAATVLRGVGLSDGDTKMPEDRLRPPPPPKAGSSSRTPYKDRTTRQRVYERPMPEKEKNKHPIKTIGGRVMLGKGSALSIRGAAKSVTPPIRGLRRDLEARQRGRGRGSNAGEPSVSGVSNVALLKAYVTSRYDPQRKFLNLERLADDPFWKTHEMQPLDAPESAKDLGAVILKIAGQLKPPVQTLSLAHNRFQTLKQLAHVNRYLPDLVNLSLQDNKLPTSKELSFLASKSGTPSKIKELIFLDNPFRTVAEKKNNVSTYRSDVARLFPHLEMLDLTPMTKIGFDSTPEVRKIDRGKPDPNAPKEFSVQIGPAVLPDNIKDLVTTFLANFLLKFDQDRPSLIDAYAPNATFSYAISTGVPPRARIKKFFHSAEFPFQKNLSWTHWQPDSRNLTRVTNVEKSATMLSSTSQDVIKAFQTLPLTKHDIIGEGAKNFLVDAWAVDGVVAPETSPPNGTALFVTIHGQFAELPAKGIRSFDRTFILAPAADGSRAKLAGWQTVVLSDQLSVRNYSSPEAWAPGPISVQAPEPTETGNAAESAQQVGAGPQQPPLAPMIQPAALQPTVPQPILNNELLASLPPQERELTVQLQMQTGLNTQFAGECLNANGWDLARALGNFQLLRATIPPEAFQ